MYCSVECQRMSWKDHKLTCGKRLFSESELNNFLSGAIEDAINLDLGVRNGRCSILVRNTILIAEYHFDDGVPDEGFRHLKNGAVFQNDLPYFCLRNMMNKYFIDESTVTSLDVAWEFAIETREQLEMRRNSAEDRIMFLDCIFTVNMQLGDICIKTMRYDRSLQHISEALVAAREGGYENDRKPSNLIRALQGMANIHSLLRNGEEAAKFAEEAYVLVSNQHGPEHPDVQDSATYLINSYLDLGKFVDAERFARVNYESLIDPTYPIDRKSEFFALGKLLVAKVWSRTPFDQRIGGFEAAEEAEMLARESCDILENFGKESDSRTATHLSSCYSVLVRVMRETGKSGKEIEATILKALSFTKECRVGEVPRIQVSVERYDFVVLLGNHYFVCAEEDVYFGSKSAIGFFRKAKYAFEEAVVIATELFTSDSPSLIECIKKLELIDEGASAVKKLILELQERGEDWMGEEG
jgi:hypothetical protein